MTQLRLQSLALVVLAALASLGLAGCETRCSCPECPRQTVVNPNPSTTIVTPPPARY